MSNGDTSSWRGRVVYDYQAIMPVSISLNGRLRSHTEDVLRISDVTFEMQLKSGTFQKG